MSFYTNAQDEQRDRAERDEADAWCTEQARTVHAKAGLDGPWGAVHPVAWAYASGRITAGSVPEWRARYDDDPGGVARNLAQCYPALGPQGPRHLQATVMAAGGAVSIIPEITAAPPDQTRAARNAVEELRATHPGLVSSAEAGGPPPELFPGSGDQPRTTASGIEVSAISGLPWRARLAAAWAPDRHDAFKITQDYGGPDGDEQSMAELGNHPAVTLYVTAVENWARTSGIQGPGDFTTDDAKTIFGPGATA